jgi:L-alanine-DL-glutamate epimerase-like enolase superfamily enzyme
MKITKVEPIVLRQSPEEANQVRKIPSPSNMAFTGDYMYYRDGNEEAIILRIETDEGIDGIGEVDGPGPLVEAIIHAPPQATWWRAWEEVLVGENPLEVGYLWEKMYRESGLYGRRGIVINVMSGLDCALWDIAGKYYKQPIYRLIGGGGKGTATPYMSFNRFGKSEEEIRERCARVKNSNFKAVKFHNHPIGVDDRTALRFVELARNELGDGIEMMLDAANHYQDAKAAIRFAKSIEPFDPYFLEAPLSADNLEGYARLSEATTIKIAAGEEQTTRWMAKDLIEKGKIDIIQPDTTWSGGITEVMRIGRMAYDGGALCIPHCYKSFVGLASNLHVSASLPNSPFCECPTSPLPLARELTNEQLGPGPDGKIALSERPGLGVTLNEKIVEKYRFHA